VVDFGWIDMVPHVAERKTRQALKNFVRQPEKKLFQHCRHFSDLPILPANVGYEG